LIDPLETCRHITGLMGHLHPTLWQKAYWEIGREIRGAVVKAQSFTGQFAYDPCNGTLCGWRVEWTKGSELQLRAEDRGHMWIIR